MTLIRLNKKKPLMFTVLKMILRSKYSVVAQWTMAALNRRVYLPLQYRKNRIKILKTLKMLGLSWVYLTINQYQINHMTAILLN